MISQRLLETLRFFRRNLLSLFLVTAPFALLSQGIQWWQGDIVTADAEGQIKSVNAIAILLVMLVQPFSDAALATQLGAIQNGRPRSLAECLLTAVTSGPFLLAAYLIVGLALITPLLLLAPVMAALTPRIGAMIFAALSLWIFIRLSLTPFLVVLEGRDPLLAVKTSFMRTQPQQWPMLGAVLLMALLAAFTLELLGQGILQLAGENPFSDGTLALLGGLAGALVMVMVFRFYVLTDDREGDAPEA